MRALGCALLAACSDAPSPAFDLANATVADVQEALRSGSVNSRDIAPLVLERVAAFDDEAPALNAILETNPDLDAAASALDSAFADSGPVGPLHCVPLRVRAGDPAAPSAGTRCRRSLAVA